MDRVTLYGAAYSVYVRIARLVLEETAVPYELVEVDVFAKGGPPPDHARRHPFGKIPAFEHGNFRLFETDAITTYVLDTFGDRGLVPPTPQDRARAVQLMRVMDNYAYPRLVWGVFVEEVERGRPADIPGTLTADAIESARHTLSVIDGPAGSQFLVGDRLTLADLWALPMLTYLRLAPTGRTLLAGFPKLSSWLDVIGKRPSAVVTRFPLELKSAGKILGGA